MSTLRTTTLKHGSSTIDNIVFDNQGRSTFGGNALFVNAQNQRVGVNTTSPSVALDVDGAINATGNIVFGGQLNLTGNLTVDTDTLFVDATNNRVGINTLSPASTLDVNGTLRCNDNFRLARSSIAPAVTFNNSNYAGGDGQIAYFDTGSFSINTNGGERLRLTADGNLGIKLTNPGFSLDCRGDGRFRSLNNGDDVEVILREVNGGGTVVADYKFRATNDTIQTLRNSSVLTTLNSSGDLGLGTTTPGVKLDVVGTVAIRGAAQLQLFNTANSSGVSLQADGGTNPAEMTFNTGGSEAMRIDGSRRLIIGQTSAPLAVSEAKLQVAASFGPNMVLYRADSSVNDNTNIGMIRFYSNASSSKNEHARISVRSDGASGATSTPGKIEFYTTPTSSITPVQRFIIRADGNAAFTQNNGTDYQRVGCNGFQGNGDGSTVENFSVRATVNEDVSTGISFQSRPNWNFTGTQNNYYHFSCNPNNINSGTLSSQYGYWVNDTLNGATNNFGFYSNISQSPGDWGFYSNGTAANFFAGSVLFNNNNQSDIEAGNVNGKLISQSAGILYSARDAVIENNHVIFTNPNGPVGSITTTASATAYNTASDYRLKENVTPMKGAADRVEALKPCRFNFKADATQTVDGFLAHEAQEVVPEAVTGEKDGEEMQAIDASKLVPLLTAALQEALERIKVLEQRVLE